MSDLSANSSSDSQASAASRGTNRALLSVKKGWSRLLDWFAIQSMMVKSLLVLAAFMIPALGLYSASLLQRQAAVVEQVRQMTAADEAAGATPYAINPKLPIAFGTGSILSFLDGNPVERITVIYKPLMWNVSERVVLIESKGKQYAYYPSDMETKIFSDKAVQAPWGGKIAFVPRADLDSGSIEVLERIDQRFSGARPQSEKDAWKAGVSGLLSATLTVGLIGFLAFQLKGQFKALKFLEPSQVQGSIDDLVGMDDIKAEVAQIKDQYLRRAEYAEYGISKPFNVMFSGPAGTGKTKLASYLAKELNLPILFHSAANLETGFVAGGSNTLSRIVAMAKRRRRCIVFLDEAQDLFMKRGGHRKFDDDTQNMLLAILDGVRTRHEAEIIWIVASNFNSEQMQMDDAMLRRFQMKVDFRMPNRQERAAIIDHYLAQRADKVEQGMDRRHLVEITEGRSPADLETIVNQAGISAVQVGAMIGEDTLMKAAERVLVGNVNANTTKERDRDRRIIAIHEWGHFLVDFELERKRAGGDWIALQSEMKTIKISLKANPRNNALGFVFHKQGANLLKTKSDIEHDVRVLLGGMANEELFFGEDGTTNGAHNDITRVTKLLHHAVGEMGMYRRTRLNFGALSNEGGSASRNLDEETRGIMEAQSERLYSETKQLLLRLKPLTEHLTGKLLDKGEMSLQETLFEIRSFEAACHEFSSRVGMAQRT
ncbi:AAA family ATPase [Caenimonas koreensis]|uniref:AAA family ATPase n=1 Tax=Caenimonas koreensis TaxID=367474 RepID=UPI00378436A5